MYSFIKFSVRYNFLVLVSRKTNITTHNVLLRDLSFHMSSSMTSVSAFRKTAFDCGQIERYLHHFGPKLSVRKCVLLYHILIINVRL